MSEGSSIGDAAARSNSVSTLTVRPRLRMAVATISSSDHALACMTSLLSSGCETLVSTTGGACEHLSLMAPPVERLATDALSDPKPAEMLSLLPVFPAFPAFSNRYGVKLLVFANSWNTNSGDSVTVETEQERSFLRRRGGTSIDDEEEESVDDDDDADDVADDDGNGFWAVVLFPPPSHSYSAAVARERNESESTVHVNAKSSRRSAIRRRRIAKKEGRFFPFFFYFWFVVSSFGATTEKKADADDPNPTVDVRFFCCFPLPPSSCLS
jgi:hypothetical protein